MPRPPKPTSVLQLQGTARKDRHANRFDLEMPSEVLTQPEWLTGEGLAEWERHLQSPN